MVIGYNESLNKQMGKILKIPEKLTPIFQYIHWTIKFGFLKSSDQSKNVNKKFVI